MSGTSSLGPPADHLQLMKHWERGFHRSMQWFLTTNEAQIYTCTCYFDLLLIVQNYRYQRSAMFCIGKGIVLERVLILILERAFITHFGTRHLCCGYLLNINVFVYIYYIYLYLYLYVCVCMCVCIYLCMFMNVCVYVYMYIYVYIYIYIDR